jgi:hypothetical protein
MLPLMLEVSWVVGYERASKSTSCTWYFIKSHEEHQGLSNGTYLRMAAFTILLTNVLGA